MELSGKGFNEKMLVTVPAAGVARQDSELVGGRMENSTPGKAASSLDSLAHAELKRLEQNLLFSDLPPRRVSAVLKNCQCLRLPEKTEVYRRGESGKEMCIVLSGGVKVSTLSADGKEIIFDLLSEGDFFGELSLLDGKPRTATVTTLVPSVLAILEQSTFMPFLEGNPATAIRLLHVLAGRLRTVDTLLEEVHFFDSETRLAKRVIALKNIYGKAVGDSLQIELRISQQDMANLVGISRESVNRHLKKWEKAEIVSLRHGRLIIRNLSRLQELAGN